jgi:hypothetical protein
MTHEPKGNGILEQRFGLIAIRRGFITQDLLVRALEIQVLEEIEFGTHRKIGEILSGQAIMSADQVEEVLKEIDGGAFI